MDPALVSSLAALAISGVALYLAALRPAEIVFDVVEAQGALRLEGAWDDAFPPVKLSVAVSIWNTGAQGGVLQGAGICALSGPSPWERVASRGLYPTSSGSTSPHQFPRAFEAGEVEIAFLHGDLAGRTHDAEEFAKSLRNLEQIRLEVSWTFIRNVGLPQSLLRGRVRRSREVISRTIPTTIDCRHWRNETVQSWAAQPERAHLAEAAGHPAG